MLAKFLLPILILLSFPALAETHDSPDGSFSFTTPDGWEDFDQSEFALVSPDGFVLLKQLPLKSPPTDKSLKDVNDWITFVHHRDLGGTPGEPQIVSGNGWKGILQSQETKSGGYEYQLVAKSETTVLVFYLALPVPGSQTEVDLKQLEQVLLSLTINSREGV
jgi:hypothetical protein